MDDHSDDSEEEEQSHFGDGSTVDELDSTDDEEALMNSEEGENDQEDISIQALVYRHRRDIRNPQLDDLIYLVFGRPTRYVPVAAFSDCHALQNVTFCEGIQTIGKKAFRWCQSLKTIAFPKSLQRIEEKAFHNCGLESIEFNEGLQVVAFEAFSLCRNLKKIKFPLTVSCIATSAFSSCLLLECVDFGTGA